jgi:ParB-like nuclease domain
MPDLTHEPIAVLLSRARRDPSFWPRHSLCESRIREFREIYQHHGREGLDPLVVAPRDAEGWYLVLDGWHRIEAAQELGMADLPAVVRLVASDQEAYEAAVRFSSRGPRPMSWAEKRDAVDRLLEMDPRRSDRTIAEIAGVSHPFVAARRRMAGRQRQERGPRVPTPDRYALSLMKAARSMYEKRRQGQLEGGRAPADNAAGGEMAVALAAAAEKCCGGQAELWLERVAQWAQDARPWLKANRE